MTSLAIWLGVLIGLNVGSFLGFSIAEHRILRIVDNVFNGFAKEIAERAKDE